MVSLPICWACRDYAILPPEVAILGEMCGFPPNIGEYGDLPQKGAFWGGNGALEGRGRKHQRNQ